MTLRSLTDRSDLVALPRGIFEVRVYRGRRLIEHVVDRNLVVNGMKATLANLLGAGTAAHVITQIAFGSSGAVAAVGDVRPLQNEYLRAIGLATYPLVGQVRFAWSLGAAEANGLAIREFGLVTTGGVLVARKSRASAIQKENDVTLEGSWTLVF
ncbi:MAG: hypothetical protein WD825_17410 [Gemmatimonadaceae bacterium]